MESKVNLEIEAFKNDKDNAEFEIKSMKEDVRSFEEFTNAMNASISKNSKNIAE